MSSSTTNDKLTTLRAALTNTALFCTGTAPLAAHSRALFYRDAKGLGANWLDLTDVSDAQLEMLVKACGEHGTIERTKFSSSFDVHATDILQHIHTNLFCDDEERERMKVELDQLDVHGPGSCTPSKNTTRDKNVLATLIVVFPTLYEGGSLHLRRGAEEWTFDSAAAICASTTPSIAYIAFTNDLEPELAPIQSGYRVSLTYHLSLTPESSSPIRPFPTPKLEETALQTALQALLDDAKFMPNGGLLGFGLQHHYTITPGTPNLRGLLSSLQGTDALIHRTCHSHLSLKTTLKAVLVAQRRFSAYKYNILISSPRSFEGTYLENGLKDVLLRLGGKVIRDYGTEELEERYKWMEKGDEGRRVDSTEVLWVRPLTSHARFSSTYLMEGVGGEGGGGVGLGYARGDVCLVVRVGPPGARGTVKAPAEEREKERAAAAEEKWPIGEKAALKG